MFGPSILGPTRWPFRFQPFAAFLVIMVAANALQTAEGEKRDPWHFTGAWKWIAPVAWLALTAFRPRLYPMFLTVVLLVAIAAAHRLFTGDRRRLFAPVLGASVVLTTLYLVMASPSPAMPGDRNAPSSRATITQQYSALDKQRVFVLQGDLAGAQTIEKKRGRFRLIPNPPGSVTATEMADGNIILAGDLDVEFVTGYSAMPHEALVNTFMTRMFGWSTEGTAPALFSKEKTTGRYWIDLMGVTRLLVQRGQQLDWLNAALPADYELSPVAQTDNWVLFATMNDSVRLVTHTGDGSIVIARPVTPGMQIAVNGKTASFSTLNGVLPVVKATPDDADAISISYRLPHQNLIVAMMALGLVALAWLGLAARRR